MKRAVNALQNFGKSLYGPVLILPIVGLFIAFGNVLGNGNLAEYLPLLGHPFIQNIGQLIAKSAVSVLVNLALIFAVGIPVGWPPAIKATRRSLAGDVYRLYQRHEYHTAAAGSARGAGKDESSRPEHGAGHPVLEMGSSPGSSPARFRATGLYRLQV